MAPDQGREDLSSTEGPAPLGVPPPGDAPVGTPLPRGEPVPTTAVVWEDSRLGRLTDRIRWAAAPLGFLLFLAAITVHGLVDGPGADEGFGPAAGPAPSASTPATAETTDPATTEASTIVPTTTAEAPPAAPDTPEAPATTGPPAPPPPTAGGGDEETVDAPVPAASRFGPVCNLVPGQTVHISVNGRPGPTVHADEDGCVTVRR